MLAERRTDLGQWLSCLQDVAQVAPPVAVGLQLVTQQVAHGNATQAKPLLHPLALESFTRAWTAWEETHST